MLATSLIGLARQHELANDGALFDILDLSSDDMPDSDRFKTIAGIFPESLRYTKRRGMLDLVARMYKEVEQRGKEDEDATVSPPHYLFVIGLQRAHDLREEDSYSYSSGSLSLDDSEPTISANKQFLKILHDGPETRVHVVAWTDTLANLSRILGRSLSDFDLRVAMQMSETDSNNIIDSKSASRLGPNRALLFSEDAGTTEKFRPYGVPSEAWLDTVRGRPMTHGKPIIQIADALHERERAGD